jgi:BirA family biotin operon repressor/biotin-[acetyl-CoA-carboxylase] ligase
MNLLEFPTLDSTNEEAKRLIKNGCAQDFQVILAHEQYAGRGRSGKVWQSPPGNLYCSVLVSLSGDLKKNAQISFVAAIAIGEVLAEILPDEFNIQYKWPNDVYIGGKKIAGILLESVKSKGSNWFIIGVGVNIKWHPADLPTAATSLAYCDIKGISPKELIIKFMAAFENNIKLWQEAGFKSIKDAWLKKAYRLNEEITANFGNQTLVGIFSGMNNNGELELVSEGGKHLISSGEVFFGG